MKRTKVVLLAALLVAGLLALAAPRASADNTLNFRISTSRNHDQGFCLVRKGTTFGDAYPLQKIAATQCTPDLGFAAQWDADVVHYGYGSKVPKSWLDQHADWPQLVIHPIGYPKLYLGASGRVTASYTVWVFENGGQAWWFVTAHDDGQPGDGSYPLVLTVPRNNLNKVGTGPIDGSGEYQNWYRT